LTNRHVRREVNAAARELEGGSHPSQLMNAVCECGRGGCFERFQLVVSAFDEAVATEGWFLVASGHEPHDDRPVRREAGYSFVGPQASKAQLSDLRPGLAGID